MSTFLTLEVIAHCVPLEIIVGKWAIARKGCIMADAPITFFIPLGNDRANAGLTVRAESVDELNAVLADLTDSVNDEPAKLDNVIDSVLAIKAGLELKGLNSTPAAQAP